LRDRGRHHPREIADLDRADILRRAFASKFEPPLPALIYLRRSTPWGALSRRARAMRIATVVAPRVGHGENPLPELERAPDWFSLAA
jgi:hypothetical protein